MAGTQEKNGFHQYNDNILTFVDNHEIGMTIFVDFTNTTEKETNASVLNYKLNIRLSFLNTNNNNSSAVVSCISVTNIKSIVHPRQ